MALVLPNTVKTQLERLCRAYAVSELKLFGSAAREDFDPIRSDLDFVVEFSEPPPGMRLSTQFFGFQEELEKLFGRSVDLLEGHAIENSRLRQSVFASAVALYAS